LTPQTYSVILVYSTSHALRAEKLLHKAAIQCKLIPVPRQLSSDCGVCIRIAQGDRAVALGALRQAALEIQGVHDV
jgi:hypothetical protein